MENRVGAPLGRVQQNKLRQGMRTTEAGTQLAVTMQARLLRRRTGGGHQNSIR
jgi:hypothetical protein